MNNDIMQGQWSQLKGDVQRKWGRLTEDQLAVINGNRTRLIGKVQEAYGIARDQAEKEVAEWEKISRAA